MIKDINKKHYIKKKAIYYNEEEEKKNIVIKLASRSKHAAEVAKDYDVTRETIYLWQNEYAGGPLMKEKLLIKETRINLRN